MSEEANIWPEGHFTSVLPIAGSTGYLVKCKCGYRIVGADNRSAWIRSSLHCLEMSA